MFPARCAKLFSILGVCAMPMSLLLVGTALHDLMGKMKFDWKIGSGGVLVRLALIPVMILVCAKYLPLGWNSSRCWLFRLPCPLGCFPLSYPVTMGAVRMLPLRR